ncbi:hypothetical protein J2744_003080 [Halorubrum trapanicum]|uniref:KaiC-like domain-containing protein n=1 Tax=Halorubrum trapanicum TaxID=29284 RepID=A0A8J7UPZ3_9EURY|nr:hypothetical protein [Halorubrum trapanicum]MBP1903375.1 hypothetical protein [Halorubrum trapanicum]
MDLPVCDGEATFITGPTLSGRRRLLHRTLRESPGQPAMVATREPADSVRSRYRRLTEGDESDPVVVDCITNSLGRSPDDTTSTKYAQSPENLTSIGMKFADVLEERRTDQLSVGLTNLSPLLVYTSPSDVFQFVNILVQKSIGTGWSVFVTIDPTVHDASTVQQFVPLFDAVIETRRTDDGDQELRVRKPEQTDWEAF